MGDLGRDANKTQKMMQKKVQVAYKVPYLGVICDVIRCLDWIIIHSCFKQKKQKSIIPSLLICMYITYVFLHMYITYVKKP